MHLSNFEADTHDFGLYVNGLTAEAEDLITNGRFPAPNSAAEEGSLSRSDSLASPIQPLEFEHILRYAEFPDLNRCPTSRDDSRKDFDEVERVLKWLKGKSVREIVKLKVPDRLHSPHHNEIIWTAVHNFSVKTLNWRKMDMYLGGFSDRRDEGTVEPERPVNSNLKKLYLYSSGNQAVLDHWFSESGKGGLRDLKVIMDSRCSGSIC